MVKDDNTKFISLREFSIIIEVLLTKFKLLKIVVQGIIILSKK